MEFKMVDEILKDNEISQNNTITESHMEFTGERLIPHLKELTFLYQEHIVRYLFASQFVKSKIILDAACGTGYGSSLMSEHGAKKVLGVDISKEAIDYCKTHYKKENLEFKIDNCTKLQLDNSYFDVIVSFEAIEHLKEPDSFLSEVKRVLKNNGLFVVSTPNKLMYQGSNQFHVTEYTEQEFLALLKKYFSFVEILYQSYPASLSIYKPGQSENITVDFPDRGIKNDHDSAMYFVALCSDKIPEDYDNKLYLFNNKTILQQEYSILKKQVTDLKRELCIKEMEIARLESETKSYKLNSDESRSELIDYYKKQIVELQQILNETNIRLDNLYKSFTKNIMRTYAEEILDRVYREILMRQPDELAIRHYLPRLQSNELSEEDLRKLLSESDEAKSLRTS